MQAIQQALSNEPVFLNAKTMTGVALFAESPQMVPAIVPMMDNGNNKNCLQAQGRLDYVPQLEWNVLSTKS